MIATLEHAHVTVSDNQATAAWMQKAFDWHLRWQGPVTGGSTVHVGTRDSYLALYTPTTGTEQGTIGQYRQRGGLNHLAVTVPDLDATEARVRAAGFTPHSHADYAPGRRFYFLDDNGIEFEVVCYA